MSPEQMRKFGGELAAFIDEKASELQLDGDSMLTLLLTVTFQVAEKAGLNPQSNPRALFDRAARIWGLLSRVGLVQVIEHVKPKDIIDFSDKVWR